MPAGINAAGNLNIFVFEVLMITTADDGTQTVRTVGIHPMVIVPETYRCNDASRSTVTQTHGVVHTKAPRALRQVTFQGTFGQDSVGLLLYVGTGDVRFERFYNEVIRLPDAMSKEQVDEATNDLTGTPFVRLLLAPYDESNTVFAVNYYDFWHGHAYSVNMATFSWTRAHRQGGATGLIHYSLNFGESGPIVDGSPVSAVLNAIFAVMTIWDDVNGVLESYTATALTGSVLNLGTIVVGQLEETLEAVKGQLDSIRDLVNHGATLPTTSAGVAEFFEATKDLQEQSTDLAATIQEITTGEATHDAGAVDLAKVDGEGNNAEIVRVTAIDDLDDLADAARWQEIAGVGFGMSAADYQAFLLAEASADPALQRPNVRDTRPYTVSIDDTANSIATAHGVTWSEILSINGLLTEEALASGTVLDVPGRRHFGPTPTLGIEVLGSNIGQNAWGVDLRLDENAAAANGDFQTVAGEDCLKQALDVLVEEYAGELLRGANQIPVQARIKWLVRKLRTAILRDGRFVGVTEVDSDQTSTALFVSLDVTALNGTTIRLGEVA